jgi:CHASE2 domain-containing sensor protein
VNVSGDKTRMWRSAALGAGLSVVLGVALARLPLGQSLAAWSYDLAFAFRPPVTLDEVLIVGIDEKSLDTLNQKPGQAFDRTWHAALLDRLGEARLVVLDIQLADASDPAKDAQLSQAIRRNGKVVLPAELAPLTAPLVGYQIRRAQEQFLTNALGWGIARRDRDADNVSRRHYPGVREAPGLAWAAAKLAGAPVTQATPESTSASAERWLNYYGPNAIRVVSYADVLEPGQSPALWSNKCVFVGYLPHTQYPGMAEDEAATPFASWAAGGAGRTGGVEILATAFLNLCRGDWLQRLPAWTENLVLLLTGLGFGCGLRLLRPRPAAALAVAGILGIAVLGVWLVWSQHLWFAWVVVAGVQIPFAYLSAVTARAALLSERAPEPQARLEENAPEPSGAGLIAPRSIPNHDLLRCVGEGAYGQVWLARNAVGLHFAVKIVTRARFPDAGPYEREFRGIEKYMPVSMSHPGLLQILHVGRDEARGYFYYVMELGDDAVSGQQIEPERYTPKSLANEIRTAGRLAPEACVPLMLHLSQALEHLHGSGCIHRDIKPANIIYVRGTPKFADIGLVTDIAPGGAAPTLIGTEGYIPPEGPGTVTADLYSLGMVLYVAMSGLPPAQFPELPTAALESSNPLQKELLKIVFKACESDLPHRYQSAAELRADLLRLQAG